MGYRSEVSLTIKKTDFNKLTEEVKQSTNEMVKYMFNNAQKFVCDEYITLYWNWVKWYEDFGEIRFFEDFYQNLENYHFIRIGEDNCDVQEDYNGEYIGYADICRGIIVSGDKSVITVDCAYS